MTMRIVAMLALTLSVAGCGSSGNSSPVSEVTVTVRSEGAVVASGSVFSSTKADRFSMSDPVDYGEIIERKETDASGQATFTVPASTATGDLCFTSDVSLSTGGHSTLSTCTSLNGLQRNVTLDHDDP